MTEKSCFLLEHVRSQIEFIPVTTRSMAQYKRIHFPSNCQPEYALTTNGGILLHQGVRDREWYQKSLSLTRNASGDLKDGMQMLEKDPNRILEVRLVDGLFVYTKSQHPKDTLAQLRNQLDLNRVSVVNHNQKIYIVPKELDKGTALERMKERMKADYIICAGDSVFDLPMLYKADLPILPKKLQEEFAFQQMGQFSVEGNGVYSDIFLAYLIKKLGIESMCKSL